MDIISLYNILAKEASRFYHSTAFFAIKILIGIYIVVLLYDIILMLVQRGFKGDWRQMAVGMNIPKELATKKGKLAARWEKIRQRLESGNESEYKVAIIEADNIVDDLISKMGYKGANFAERLDNIPEGQLENIEEMREAHEIRNRIIHEEDFKLTREEAKDVLHNLEHLLRYFEVLD